MREIFVCSMLLMAGIDDMKRNRISNCIVIPAIILSVIYKVYFDGFLYAMRGIKDMTLICLIFLPVFKLRGIGAGDIKLFCMITGFYGFIFGIKVAALTIMFAGVAAVYRVLKYPYLLNRFFELKNYLLYGVCGAGHYFAAEKSERAVIIRMAPLTAAAYFLVLLVTVQP